MWLHIPPSMDSQSAQESADWMNAPHELGDDDIELFVTSSGMLSAQPLSWRGWKTRPWIRLLFGTLSRPSMADRGAERWISSLLGSRVSLGRVPGNDRGEPTYVGCGLTYYAWSLKFDQPLSSWRTARAWTREQCEELCDDLATSPELFAPARRTSAHPTAESDGSVWPTPTATDAKASGAAGYSTASGRHSGTTLTDAAVRIGPRAQVTSVGQTGRVLNPQFVETLMGYSPSWTHPLFVLIDFALLGTPLYLSKPSMRFAVFSPSNEHVEEKSDE